MSRRRKLPFLIQLAAKFRTFKGRVIHKPKTTKLTQKQKKSPRYNWIKNDY